MFEAMREGSALWGLCAGGANIYCAWQPSCGRELECEFWFWDAGLEIEDRG